jgi:hypothetical protein
MIVSEQAHLLATAVHAALRDDPAVRYGLGGANDAPPRLYDAAPEDPVFPYLTYGALRSEDIGADDSPLASHQMTLHLWSRYAGRAEVLSLLSQITHALRADVLTAAGDINVRSASAIYADVLSASDGRTKHGLLRLSFTTEPFTTQPNQNGESA